MIAEIIFWCAIVFMAACSLYFGPRIKTERIPMQWGLDGRPTWTAPKTVGVWFMVAFSLATRLLIWVCVTYIPAYTHDVELGLVLSSIVLVAVHLFILISATRLN